MRFLAGAATVGSVEGAARLVGETPAVVSCAAAVEGLSATWISLPIALLWGATALIPPLRRWVQPFSRLGGAPHVAAGAVASMALPLLAGRQLDGPMIIALSAVITVAAVLSCAGRRATILSALAIFSFVTFGPMLGLLHSGGPSKQNAHQQNQPILAASDAPCILLISIDTLRADRVGGSRDRQPLTPFLDELTGRGTRLQFRNSSNQTGPSHASLLTGRGFLEHPVNINGVRLPPYIPTVAQDFSRLGWDTVSVVANPLLSAGMGVGRGFDIHDDRLVRFTASGFAFRALMKKSWRIPFMMRHPSTLGPIALYWRMQNGETDMEMLKGDNVVDIAREHLRNLDTSRRPFFMFTHFMDPHDACDAPAPFRFRFASTDGGGFSVHPKKLESPTLYDMVASFAAAGDSRTAGLLAEAEARYDEEVMYVDNCIRRLVAEAERACGDRPLWIVVTSDHGEHFLEKGLMGHGNSILEPLLDGFLIVAGAGIAGSTHPPRIHEEVGPFLLNAVTDREPSASRGEILIQGYGNLLAVRSGAWKLILSAERPYGKYIPESLFNLDEDPDESADRLPTESARVDEILGQLHEYRTQLRRFLPVDSPIDSRTKVMLDGLGYVVGEQ